MITAGVLALVACLTGQPTRCERFEVMVETCELPMPAFAAAIRWAQERPQWTLKRVGPCQVGIAA